MAKTEAELHDLGKAPTRDNDLSARTYSFLKEKLENRFGNDVEIFLQGSYANSTNIKKDSDIDIVLCYKKSYFYDIKNLSDSDKKTFHENSTPASYKFNNFKDDVESYLISIFGNSVKRKNKCIAIQGHGTRVDADIVPCFEHYRYSSYNTIEAKGIQLNADNGEEIISFPKQHIENGEIKNINTTQKYKLFVRIIKNCKKTLIENNIIEEDLVSSFLLECLVYNINNFTFNTKNTIKENLNLVISSIYDDMGNYDKYSNYLEVCRLYYLLRGGRVKSSVDDIKLFLIQVYSLVND